METPHPSIGQFRRSSYNSLSDQLNWYQHSTYIEKNNNNGSSVDLAKLTPSVWVNRTFRRSRSAYGPKHNIIKVLPGGPTGGLLKGEDQVPGRKQCRVLFSYTPAHEDELALEVDERIDYICEVEDGWWKGRLNGRVGVFPSNFVEMCNTDCDKSNSNYSSLIEKNKKNSLQGSMLTNGSSVLTSSNKIKEPQKKESISANILSSNLNRNMTTSERQLRNTAPAPDTAPRLPPKPVKEQCVVLYPYTAQNEDELSLAEGQTITVLSREVEDKGWWKGELDGRVGVFPDNFVKLLPQETTEEEKDKRPHRPPTSSTEQLFSSNLIAGVAQESSSFRLKRSASGVRDRQPETTGFKKTGSSEKLAKKVGDIFHKSTSSLSDNKSEVDARLTTTAGTHSTVGGSSKAVKSAKATESAVQPPPVTSNSDMVKPVVGGAEEKDREEVIQVVDTSDGTVGLEGVVEREGTLTSVTARRVKAPKRRPPSNVFLKENIPDITEIAVDSEDEIVVVKKEESQSEEIKIENNQNVVAPLREKQGRVVLGVPVFAPKEGGKEDSGQKPSWLEELSRKQANRKSGIFPDEKKPEGSSSDLKPFIPTKPSDSRKPVGNFTRRPNSFGEKSPPSKAPAGAAVTSDPTEPPDKPPRTPFLSSVLSRPSGSSSLQLDQADIDPPPQLESLGSTADLRRESLRKAAESSSPKRSELETADRIGESSRKTTGTSDSNSRPSDSGRKSTSSSSKHSEGGRKQSDSGSKTADSKPSVHSTNLGKPESRNFAGPERPSDLTSAKSDNKSSAFARRISNNSAKSTDSMDTGDVGYSNKTEPESFIGWSNHIVKPGAAQLSRLDGPAAVVNHRTDNQTGDKVSLEKQVDELREALASVQAQFAGQIAMLRAAMVKEREKRVELETEVASLKKLIRARAEE